MTRCPYCDKVMRFDKPPKRPKGMPKKIFRPTLRAHFADYGTRDHIVPQSLGGRAWVWACGACNADKRELTLLQWRIVLSLRRGRPVIFPFEWTAIRSAFTSLLCTLGSLRFA